MTSKHSGFRGFWCNITQPVFRGDLVTITPPTTPVFSRQVGARLSVENAGNGTIIGRIKRDIKRPSIRRWTEARERRGWDNRYALYTPIHYKNEIHDDDVTTDNTLQYI